MAQKQTGIYRANVTWKDGSAHYYYYGRNMESVERAVFERFRAMKDFGHAITVKVIKVGTFAYTINEPVVEFTPEETSQIENHYFKEMIRNEVALQRAKQYVAGISGPGQPG